MDPSNKTEMPFFTPACFWNADYKKLDIEKDKNYIISRVINGGLEKDIHTLFKIYGYETMKEEIIRISYMSKKTLNYWSIIFNVKKENFKAFSKRDDLWL